jgi:hypothetical protein
MPHGRARIVERRHGQRRRIVRTLASGVAILLMSGLGACSGSSGTQRSNGTDGADGADACPVTYRSEADSSGGLYGTAPLQVYLQPSPVVVDRLADGTYSMKIGWQRGEAGWPEITAEQLNGDGVATAHVDQSGPATGGMPSNLVLSQPGCWSVHGSMNGADVTFVAEVRSST